MQNLLQRTWAGAHPHDRRWLQEHANKFPLRFRRAFERYYEKGKPAEHRRGANLRVLALVDNLPRPVLSFSCADSEIRAFAARRATQVSRAISKSKSLHQATKAATTIARQWKVDLPPDKNTSADGRLARLQDDHWWRRGVRKSHGRDVETVAQRLGMVSARSEIYCSNETVTRRRQQKTRNRLTLEAMQAVNELGDSFSLQELAELSVSNPTIRRCELMTRMRGFEEYADQLDYVALFATVTCPSRMHSQHYHGGTNEKYDGTTPRQAQQHLAKVWARTRAALQRRNVHAFGFRVAEPHHDGTPHWHLLIFVERHSVDEYKRLLRHYALQVDGTEPGAYKRRCTFIEIDRARGSATGYLAKYVAKNIDGYGIETDLFGTDAKAAAERVDAWASVWGIRQFQQIGGPSVTVWRELRRYESGIVSGDLAEAIHAADVGNWCLYCQVMAQASIKLHKVEPLKDRSTGELELNRYGEPMPRKVIGVECGGVIITTRVHQWRIEPRPEGDSPPWTCVNNCTGLMNNELAKQSGKFTNESGRQQKAVADNGGGGSGGP